MFSFERIRKGFERTIGIGFYGRGFTGIIKEGIHRFLQHTFFVTQNHIRRLNFYQTLETIVTNDYTAIEVIEIGGSKTSPIQRHQRTQFRRNHWNDLHDHPFRVVLPILLRIAERLHYLQALKSLGLTLLGGFCIGTMAQVIRKRIEVKLMQKIIECLSPHLGYKLVRVCILQVLVFHR